MTSHDGELKTGFMRCCGDVIGGWENIHKGPTLAVSSMGTELVCKGTQMKGGKERKAPRYRRRRPSVQQTQATTQGAL